MVDFDCLEKVEGSNEKHELVLYALSTCGWCKKARGFLDDNDIAYRYVYVDQLTGGERDEVVDVIRGLNPKMTFPTLVVDDSDVVTGFNEPLYKGKLL